MSRQLQNFICAIRANILFALLITFCEGKLHAQDQNPFNQVLTNQGASIKNITSLFKDKEGFLWIGTQEGLYRYDGRDFTEYQHQPADSLSLPSSYITAVAQDNRGTIWVGTLLGLSYLEAQTQKFIKVFPGKNEPGDPTIMSLCASADRIWFGLYWKIGSFEFKRKKIETYPLPEENPLMRYKIKFPQVGAVNQMIEWKPGELWLATGVGIHKFNIKKSKWQLHLYPSVGDDQLNDNLTLSLANEGTDLWFGTWGGGLKKYDTAKRIFETILFNDTNLPKGAKNIAKHLTIANVNKPHFLISSLDKGLMLFDKGTKQFQSWNITENQNNITYVTETLVDNQGITWLATASGLYKSDPFKNRFKWNPIADHLFNNDLKTVGLFEEYPDAKKVLMMIVSDGLLLWNRETNKMERVGQTAVTLLQDVYYARLLSSDFLFLGGRLGCGVLQLSTNHFKLLEPTNEKSPKGVTQVFDLGKHKAGLVLSRKGVVQYDSTANKLTYLIDAADSTRGIAFNEAIKVSDSVVFIASSLGLIKLDPERNKYQIIKAPSFTKFQIHSLAQVKDKRIFLGTYFGLFIYDGKQITRVPLQSPYPFSIITKILVDGNYLWMSTNRGLVKFNWSDLSISQFTSEDGFRRDQLNDLGLVRLSDRTILVGQVNGFYSFHPDSLITNRTPPSVFMTVFNTRKENRDIHPGEETTLAYDNNQFTFKFVGLNFAQPERNLFAHRLIGVSEQWIYTNSATYAGLRGGKYFLEVKAANNDGVWSAPSVFLIEIEKPYWETWWFRLSVVIAFLSFVYLIYLYRLKQKIKLLSMRHRISSDLHDDIGSALSSISIQSEVAKQQTSNQVALQQAMETIGETSRETLDHMNDIVWAINPRNDSFENLVSRMKIFANQLFIPKGIELTLNFPTDYQIELSLQQRKNLYLIFKEGANNAAKYSKATQVNITLVPSRKKVELMIIDNGIGFDNDKVYEGNGLRNMKQRAEELGGRFQVDSQRGKGVHLGFWFPTGNGS